MTAYSIMRAQGIELGKADYASNMFAYFRAPTGASHLRQAFDQRVETAE